jgi:hypothetical protein
VNLKNIRLPRFVEASLVLCFRPLGNTDARKEAYKYCTEDEKKRRMENWKAREWKWINKLNISATSPPRIPTLNANTFLPNQTSSQINLTIGRWNNIHGCSASSATMHPQLHKHLHMLSCISNYASAAALATTHAQLHQLPRTISSISIYECAAASASTNVNSCISIYAWVAPTASMHAKRHLLYIYACVDASESTLRKCISIYDKLLNLNWYQRLWLKLDISNFD